VRVRSLPTGAKVASVAGVLLFFSLFLTWQTLEIQYPGTGTDTRPLDAWDVWGLLIGFLTLGLVALVLTVHASDLELPANVPWELVVLVTAGVLLGLTLLKTLTDAESAWGSYVGLVLAAAAVGGAAYDWARTRWGPSAALRRRRRRRFSSAA
jgi:hypothetical protein